MKIFYFKTLFITVIFLITFSSLSCRKDDNPASNPDTVAKRFYIGGLLSLTGGNWNSLGATSRAAMEIARDEINNYFASVNTDYSISLAIADTQLDTLTAVRKTGDLIFSEVKMIIGPQSSAELRAIRNTTNLDEVLIISQSSTASSLSIIGDNIFRFCPDDKSEGAATAALMLADTVKAMVPVFRSDAGNIGLFQSTTAAFLARGGTASSGVEYGDNLANYTAVVQTVKGQANQLVNLFGSSKVGIYLASFDEAVAILSIAANDPLLSSLKWYGSDGMTLSDTLRRNSTTAAFAVKVSYPCPAFGLDEAASDRWKPVAQKITLSTGIEPDAYALAAYDAMWVIALAYQSTGGSENIALLRNAFVQLSNQYFGATGWTALNSAGDRKTANFDFWSIKNTGGQYSWQKSASYNSSSGVITRY